MGCTCIEPAASFVWLTLRWLNLPGGSRRRLRAALGQPPRFNGPCSVSSKRSSPALLRQLPLAALGMRAACAQMMVQLPSASGSREGESLCPNHSLAKIHTHGGPWAELCVEVFVSQVKKLLKRREIRTRSILGAAQKHTLYACPTVFTAFNEVQERSLTEGVFCLSITGVLGSTCRLLLPVPCFVWLSGN